MIRIGLNGFGRIGRAIARIAILSKDCELCVINELDPDVGNSAYLLNYDSIYGRFPNKITAQRNSFLCQRKTIPVYSYPEIEKVPWAKHKIDILIDATGIEENVATSRKLIKQKVPKVIITHNSNNVDATIVLGVNEGEYNPAKHHIVSSSICDTSAIAPVLHEVNKAWGVENCFVTTLHPWLSYQNLLDGSIRSVSNPGHFWKDYCLGRNSALSLIPKDTTAAQSTVKVLPELKGKLEAISFRVPTNIVSASDLTISVKNKTSAREVNSHFKRKSDDNSGIFELQEESLVSIDHRGTDKSAIIDAKRTKVLNNRMIKIIIWYDNEYGYSHKVIDIARLIKNRRQE